MVAYSFKRQFAPQIVSLDKLQTVRGHRKRHARPGEPMQLYSGMRTKSCVKLLDVDPICRDVRDISIRIHDKHPDLIEAIRIDGDHLDDAGIEAFAVLDGFGYGVVGGLARRRMGDFWIVNHGASHFSFSGVVLRWLPPVGAPR